MLLTPDPTGKECDKFSSSEFDAYLEDHLTWTPVIMSPENRRKAVFGAVKLWQDLYPNEVPSAMRQINAKKEQIAVCGDKAAHTKEGERVLGMIPEKINSILTMAFRDPHYLWNNKEVIGDLFDAFEVGRLSYPEGRGQGGSNRLTLNSADLK